MNSVETAQQKPVLRYCLQRVNHADGGDWVLVNARDDQFAWSGSFWIDRERVSRLVRFSTPEAAEAYAQQTFPQED
jgi:hypothetical protein